MDKVFIEAFSFVSLFDWQGFISFFSFKTMLRILDLHTEFIGKIAKTTSFGLVLEKEYEKIFNVGNEYKFDRLHYYCHLKNKYELSLIFIDEKPITKNGVTWFCLKEIGNGCNGDWHWLTLNQITVCE